MTFLFTEVYTCKTNEKATGGREQGQRGGVERDRGPGELPLPGRADGGGLVLDGGAAAEGRGPAAASSCMG